MKAFRLRGGWLTTAVVAAVSIAIQIGAAWWRPWHPGRWAGLLFGVSSALLFGLALLYGARRRLRARPFGTSKRWLDVHIYASVIAMLFVFLHTNFRLPAGVMGWALLLLATWTTVTGLIGRWLQRHIPRQLSRDVSHEAIYERIPDLIAALTAEADALMTGASGTLANTYQVEIRPLLIRPDPSWGWLTSAVAVRAKTLAPVTAARAYVAPGDKDRVDDLESIVRDKSDLDAQLTLQRVLRSWLIFHLPPAFLLAGLIVVHIIGVIWY